MAGLQHRNIVRLIGVCRVETIMLVMELAALGQLSKYLKNRKSDRDLQVKTVLELMFQVRSCVTRCEPGVMRDASSDLTEIDAVPIDFRWNEMRRPGIFKTRGLVIFQDVG